MIGLDVTSINNRGKPVVLNLSGSGFFAYSTVKVTWFTPRGTVYRSLTVPTNNRGLMQVALLWTPVDPAGLPPRRSDRYGLAQDTSSGRSAKTTVILSTG